MEHWQCLLQSQILLAPSRKCQNQALFCISPSRLDYTIVSNNPKISVVLNKKRLVLLTIHGSVGQQEALIIELTWFDRTAKS